MRVTIKRSLDDLAVLGGIPAFEEQLHVGRPNIGRSELFIELARDILDKRWLTNRGPYVQEFEKRIADLVGVRHCIAMCNATVALEITIRASGMKGEAIVPSMTFVATPHSLQWQEITPVFCDIDPATHNIDPRRVERLITPRTTGIIGVHLWGRPCDVEPLAEIAKSHGLKLLFDAAHAFGCTYKGRPVGNFGDAEIFSFHATKILNTFEGGAVVTNNDELAARIRLMKNFGFAGYDDVIYIGTNGKMSEVSAAMGLTGLDSLDGFISANRENYEHYRQGLEGLPGIELIRYDQKEKNNYQYIVLEVDGNRTGISRDMITRTLQAENVLARRYFYPGSHNMEPYRSYFPNSGLLLSETEGLVQRVMLLPTGTAVRKADIEAVCGLIRFVVDNGRELSSRLNGGGRGDQERPG